MVCDYSPLKLCDTFFGMCVAFSHPVILAILVLLFSLREYKLVLVGVAAARCKSPNFSS